MELRRGAEGRRGAAVTKGVKPPGLTGSGPRLDPLPCCSGNPVALPGHLRPEVSGHFRVFRGGPAGNSLGWGGTVRLTQTIGPKNGIGRHGRRGQTWRVPSERWGGP